MSTNSTIGRVLKDGSVLGIYCHFDGHPSHVGRILLNHYNTPRKIDKLLDLGALSMLGERLGKKHDFESHDVESDICLAYGRDRGDEGLEAKPYHNVEDFLKDGLRYNYVFKRGKWYVNGGGHHFAELTEEIVRAD